MKLSKTLRRKRQISWKRCYQSPPSKFDSFELYFRKKKERTCPLINLGCPRGPIIAANIAARVGVPQERFSRRRKIVLGREKSLLPETR